MFEEALASVISIFEDWRHGHEKEDLATDETFLQDVADAWLQAAHGTLFPPPERT